MKNNDVLRQLLSGDWVAFDARRDLYLLDHVPRNSMILLLHGARIDETSVECVFLDGEGALEPLAKISEYFYGKIFRGGDWEGGIEGPGSRSVTWVESISERNSLYGLLVNVVAIRVIEAPAGDFVKGFYEKPRQVRLEYKGRSIWEGYLSTDEYHELIASQGFWEVSKSGVLSILDAGRPGSYKIDGGSTVYARFLLLKVASFEDITAKAENDKRAAIEAEQRRQKAGDRGRLRKRIEKRAFGMGVRFDRGAAEGLFEKYQPTTKVDLRGQLSDYIGGWLSETHFRLTMVKSAMEQPEVAQDMDRAIVLGAQDAQKKCLLAIEKRIIKEIHNETIANVGVDPGV